MKSALASAILSQAHNGSHPKRYLQRLCTPAETLSRIAPYFSRIGITRLADVTGLDRIGIPVIMAVRPNSRSLSVSQGKGIDLESAKAGGAMESIEAYHAERIGQPIILARYNDLCHSAKIVNLERLPILQGSSFHGELTIPWIEGFDLREQASALVPFEMVHLDFSVPLTLSSCFPLNSNGLASGNSYLEAINHALCELIERDAVALWRASNEISGQRVDLATAKSDCITSLAAKIEHAGCRVAVEEVTSDIGVPVFVATLTGMEADSDVTPRPAGGAGCHPDRTIACIRAITEAAQSRLTRIAGSRDDLMLKWFEPSDWKTRGGGVEPAAPAKRFADGPNFESDTLAGDYCWLLERLERAGLRQIVVVDLAKPEFDIPVVRVIVPGLEGYSRQPGYVQGPRARRVHAA